MEMNTNGSVATAAEVTTRTSGLRSWMLALVLGAVLATAGAASVFAASPSADPSASPAATSSEDAGGATDDTADADRDGELCPEKSGSDSTESEDASSS